MAIFRFKSSVASNATPISLQLGRGSGRRELLSRPTSDSDGKPGCEAGLFYENPAPVSLLAPKQSILAIC